jgi:hypothetical protein
VGDVTQFWEKGPPWEREPAGKSDIIDIAGEIQTEKAIQFYDGKVTVWLPRSQIEIGDDGTVAMPRRLAKDKGLI